MTAAGGPIGLVANPESGKDVRRVVAHASVFDNNEKRSIIRRAVLGAVAAGAHEFVYMPDRFQLIEGILEGLDADATFTAVDIPLTGTVEDTTRAAAKMREAGCSVVVTLGGDGTNRAFAKGWREAVVVPISTGTNNVFPRLMEGTVAGAAAGVIGIGTVGGREAAARAKCIALELAGRDPDIALVDAALLDDRFVAVRAVWMPHTLRSLLLTRAEPDAVGLSSIGGLLRPLSADEDAGLLVVAGKGGQPVLAPLAPGLYEWVHVREFTTVGLGEEVVIEGPGVLALDGERELELKVGEAARLRVLRNGPWVVDVREALRLAACRGQFRPDPESEMTDRRR